MIDADCVCTPHAMSDITCQVFLCEAEESVVSILATINTKYY